MTEGRINIIDATPIEAAQSGSGKGKDGKPKRDPDGGWHVKKDSRGTLKSTYGYSVHTGVDEDGFIQRQTVTAGNVHDSQERDTLLLGDETVLDLPPEAPSFITRVCRFGFHILLRQFEQARRVRSPQISQALGALQRVFGCAEMSAV